MEFGSRFAYEIKVLYPFINHPPSPLYSMPLSYTSLHFHSTLVFIIWLSAIKLCYIASLLYSRRDNIMIMNKVNAGRQTSRTNGKCRNIGNNETMECDQKESAIQMRNKLGFGRSENHIEFLDIIHLARMMKLFHSYKFTHHIQRASHP